MALTTQKIKRDAVLAERVAAVGGHLVEVDSAKYGGDLTSYYLYITFDHDPGPSISYRDGKHLETAYHAYRVIIKGGIEALDKHTANPQHLAAYLYRERQDHHWKTRGLEELQREKQRAEGAYGRAAIAAAVAAITHADDETATAMAASTAWQRLREAVEAYEREHQAMIAVIGTWPKSDDNFYPPYR